MSGPPPDQRFGPQSNPLWGPFPCASSSRPMTTGERRHIYKLEALSDERGHADRATALAIVLPAMLQESQVDPPDTEQSAVYRVVA